MHGLIVHAHIVDHLPLILCVLIVQLLGIWSRAMLGLTKDEWTELAGLVVYNCYIYMQFMHVGNGLAHSETKSSL